MPYIQITTELAQKIKEIRKDNKVSSKDVSEYVGKSPSYISKLEKGQIKNIELNILLTIFKRIFNSASEESFKAAFEEFIGKCTLKLSKEEIEKREWLINFDMVDRKIPIPEDLVSFIKEELQNHNKSISEVVSRMNLNEDIQSFEFDISNFEKNRWHYQHGHLFIIVDISYSTIESIMDNSSKECSYFILEAFLFNLYKFSFEDKDEARKKAIDTLTKFKFYSISEKNAKLRETHSKEEVEEILTDFDKVNKKTVDSILRYIRHFSQLNIRYANEKLIASAKNFKVDPPLTIAFMGIDITTLQPLNIDNKRQFVKDVEALIEQYTQKAEKQIDLI